MKEVLLLKVKKTFLQEGVLGLVKDLRFLSAWEGAFLVKEGYNL
jgi:hypothetical protein